MAARSGKRDLPMLELDDASSCRLCYAKTMSPEATTLIAAARAAALNAYAPYSHFRVGAAVATERGVFTGCNVENASYGLCLCAERNALSTAIAAGARKVSAVAVTCVDAKESRGLNGRMPCGACRQWLLELAPDADVFIDGTDRTFPVRELLPHGFTLT
jgi:cytidine deaminase